MDQSKSVPLVSVIIPAFNAEKYISESISSVLSQTFQDFEILVVDDGSIDSTKEKTLKFSDQRIRYIYKENGGASSARNTGINNARGKYIALLDYDDLWLPEKLEKQLQKFSHEADLGLVYCWVESINPDGETRFIAHPENEGWVYNDLFLDNFLHNGSVPLIKKECFEKAGYFDENLSNAQDWEMWFRIAKDYKFGVVRDILTKYRVRSDSLSKMHRKLNKAFIKIMNKELKNAGKSIQKIKGELFSGHYYLIYRRCITYDNDKLCALKYIFLSFYHDPVYFSKNIILEKIISNLKYLFFNESKGVNK
jgi:glycosyltransferase involved in cell wall biosynthesis